jgi:hypothetical protein
MPNILGGSPKLKKPEDYDSKGNLIAKSLGMDWNLLSQEQKDSLYYDYSGEDARLNQDYATGKEAFDSDQTKMVHAGNVNVASGYGNALAELGSAYMGKKGMDEARTKQEALSKQKMEAMALGGSLAAGQQDKMIDLYSKAIDRQGAVPTAPAAPPVAPVAPPQPVPSGPPPSPSNGPVAPPNGGAGTTPQAPPVGQSNGLGGPPIRPGIAGAPPPAGSKMPSTPEEWLAYMLRATGGGG